MNMRVKHASLPSVFGDKARMLLYAIGIYSAYLTQGYVQEALSTTVYDRGDGTSERFPHLEALNGVQCVVCFLVAGVLLMLRKKRKTDGERFVSVASPLDFWKPGLTNSIGPACGLIALKNISYPAQVSFLFSLEMMRGMDFMALDNTDIRTSEDCPSLGPTTSSKLSQAVLLHRHCPRKAGANYWRPVAQPSWLPSTRS
mmetsp:Transcript_42088/g.99787  ORF Transcript_42088/g.99787 Transcript_42088/m.99787 type:complete len:200 (-) Transcript_42088:870-1469(-)